MSKEGGGSPAVPSLRRDYSEIAPVYDKTRYRSPSGQHVFARERELLRTCIREFAAARNTLLDVACGTGQFTQAVGSLFEKVIGVDLTEAMLRQAGSKQAGDGVANILVRASAEALPIQDACVDVVMSTRFLHLFGREHHGRLLSHLARPLKPGGVLIVDHDGPFTEGVEYVRDRLRRRPKDKWVSYHPNELEGRRELVRIGRLGVTGPGLPRLVQRWPNLAPLSAAFARGSLWRLSPLLVLVYRKVSP